MSGEIGDAVRANRDAEAIVGSRAGHQRRAVDAGPVGLQAGEECLGRSRTRGPVGHREVGGVGRSGDDDPTLRVEGDTEAVVVVHASEVGDEVDGGSAGQKLDDEDVAPVRGLGPSEQCRRGRGAGQVQASVRAGRRGFHRLVARATDVAAIRQDRIDDERVRGSYGSARKPSVRESSST